MRSRPKSHVGKFHFYLLAFGLSSFALHAQTTNPPTRLPEVTVRGEVRGLNEEARVGPYEQPEWTTQRRFPTTRVYVQRQPWKVSFEQWWRGRFFRDGSDGHLLQEELSLGLPYRFQFDLYENWVVDDHGDVDHHDVATELRWALADWGKIPLNPTLYGEWKFVDGSQGSDVFELKVLLGEELAPRWHWGLNLIYEQETGGGRAAEWAWSQGVSYTLQDQRWGLGVEMKFSHETEEGSRGDAEIKFLLGPSLQWRPTQRTHLDIVPLIGATHDAPRVEAFVVFGFDFGRVKGQQYAPASTRSK